MSRETHHKNLDSLGRNEQRPGTTAGSSVRRRWQLGVAALLGLVLATSIYKWYPTHRTGSTTGVTQSDTQIRLKSSQTASSGRVSSKPASNFGKAWSHPPTVNPVSINPAETMPTILPDDSPKIDVEADQGTEAVAGKTNDQLKQLAKIILKARSLDFSQLSAELSPIVAVEFECGPLRPLGLVEQYDDGAIVVHRQEKDLEVGLAHGDQDTHEYRGVDGLAKALKALVRPWKDNPDAWCKFKQFLIEPEPDSLVTTAYYEIGSRQSGHEELNQGSLPQGSQPQGSQPQGTGQHARWLFRWKSGRGDTPPRLLNIVVSDFEETVVRSKHGTLFSDCTMGVLGDNSDIESQFFRGTNHWRGRLEKRYQIPYFGQQGLAIGDVNGDGLDDVYLLQPGGLPNRLLVHQADGTVVDRSQEAGVDILDFTRSALLIDLDNDGDQDLVVSMWKRLMFLANDGHGHFTAQAIVPDMKAAYSLAAADYDRDGDLDVFACIYYPKNAAADRIAEPIPYYNATNGGKNVLIRNEGNWQFQDVTDEVGLGKNNYRFSLAASWEDYDNDGDLDLYVANDFGPNNLYRNDTGHFIDIAAELGAEDVNFGMSASWGDYNRDGWMDLYVSNMFSSAGNRVTFQPDFKSELATELKKNIKNWHAAIPCWSIRKASLPM